MKANVIAATLLAAISTGAFAQRDGGPGPADGKPPTGFPTGFPVGPGGPKPTGGFPGGPKPPGGSFPTGFPIGPGGPKPTGGFPIGPGGPKPPGGPGGPGEGLPGFPPQVPGAANPSGGLGHPPGFPVHTSGFLVHTRKTPSGPAAEAEATPVPPGFPVQNKHKGKHHGGHVPGAAKPTGSFGQRPVGGPKFKPPHPA
ncbi:hypothetical protein LX32DRAFT_647630 [Colletotrichum zoysiae]|uniref:Uncharacterized protein n=1 Tax=Colletotrichum zoysiae TaxID=1216348 RepID=A0AAD9M5P2_9PEZI|nr:hypothetical protein LX32DRAFT_647630 [Colletotrichum zoysiae]